MRWHSIGCVKRFNTVSPIPLRQVQCSVSRWEEPIAVRHSLGIPRDAERCRDLNCRALEEHGSVAHSVAQTLRQFRRSGYRRLREQNRDLLATVPGADVHCPNPIAQDFSYLLEHGIAGFVTIGVVHLLEEIDIHDDQRGRAAKTVGLRDHAPELLIEESTIGQSRQHVRASPLTDFFDLPDLFEECSGDSRKKADVPRLLNSQTARLGAFDDNGPAHALITHDRYHNSGRY